MYVFGGFNGVMLSDMYKFSPGKCESYRDIEACLKAHQGIKCVWTQERSECLTLQTARDQVAQKVVTEFTSTLDEPCEKHHDG